MSKAIKMILLATSAYQVSSMEEAQTAAYLAGRKAHASGVTLDTLWARTDGKASCVWPVVVDGWFDSAMGGAL